MIIFLTFEFFLELRLARLALDPNNSPAWEVPDQELMRPLTKMPLFVGAHPITSSSKQAEVSIQISTFIVFYNLFYLYWFELFIIKLTF